jgi:hypothetical protein
MTNPEKKSMEINSLILKKLKRSMKELFDPGDYTTSTQYLKKIAETQRILQDLNYWVLEGGEYVDGRREYYEAAS